MRCPVCEVRVVVTSAGPWPSCCGPCVGGGGRLSPRFCRDLALGGPFNSKRQIKAGPGCPACQSGNGRLRCPYLQSKVGLAARCSRKVSLKVCHAPYMPDVNIHVKHDYAQCDLRFRDDRGTIPE